MKTVNNFTCFVNAEKYAKDYHAIISLGWYLPEEFRVGKKYMYLDFEDIDLEDMEKNPTATFHDAPIPSHIKDIVDFIRTLSPTDKLLIHCVAGQSRSSAGVIIALCERDGKTYDDAKAEIKSHRIPDTSVIKPNSLMIRHYNMSRNHI
jgi:predicted protein tyrosine phosphatase